MLANVLANVEKQNMRYAPLGFMLDKQWLYERGGRPVIYESNTEFADLPDSKKHLHVRYEPNRDSDYSWEREWRIKTDRLVIDPTVTTVIVPNRNWVKKYHEVLTTNAQQFAHHILGHFLISPPEWHFIALEDLGIPFEAMEPISFEQFQLNFTSSPTK